MTVLEHLRTPCVRCGHMFHQHIHEKKPPTIGSVAGVINFGLGPCTEENCKCDYLAWDNLSYVEQEAEKKDI